jgi:hypothetical protein
MRPRLQSVTPRPPIKGRAERRIPLDPRTSAPRGTEAYRSEVERDSAETSAFRARCLVGLLREIPGGQTIVTHRF